MLVKANNEHLVQLFREATGLKKVPSVIAYGKIVGEGTLADFDRVKLAPNGEKEAPHAWSNSSYAGFDSHRRSLT